MWLCPAVVAVVELWLNAATAYADPFDLRLDFNILDADGTQVIGHGHYEITPDSGGYATISGEDRFDNGEYDVERDKLELRGDDQIPRMVNFEHTFYKANGTLQRVNRANFEAGFASCIQYESGKPVVHSAAMQFPPDTFAGAAIVIRLKLDLQGGRVGRIVLHDFSCIPGPKVLKVEAYPQSPAEWRLFPGELVRVDIKADFGWLNFVTALFAPQIHAWFSPSDDWRFVGGKFTRFYKGPEIILALSPKTNHNETRLRQGPNLTSLAQRADAPERRKLSATSVVESTEELGWINSITDVANSIKSVANSPDLNVLF